MAKWFLIIVALIIGIILGSVIEEHVCGVAKQNLGTATAIVRATCTILSIPTEIIVLIMILLGVIGYFIYNYFS